MKPVGSGAHFHLKGRGDPSPLAPFLVSLPAIGIRITIDDYHRIALALRAGGSWNLDQLRGVLSSLLVRSEDKEAIFRRHFDAFFRCSPEEPAFPEIDLERALQDLRSLAGQVWWRGMSPVSSGPVEESGRPADKRPPRRDDVLLPSTESPPPAPPPARLLARVAFLAPAALVLVAVGVALYQFVGPSFYNPKPPEPRPPVQPGPPATSTPVKQPEVPRSSEEPPLPRMRMYMTPTLTASVRPGDRPLAWKLALVLLSISVPGYAFWIVRWIKRHRANLQDSAARPRLFRTASIGGAPWPRLDRATLDRFADSLGYFRSEVTGRALNVSASVETTARSGGIPSPIFESRRLIRSVVILEDLHAEAATWNPIAGELARGLNQRRVPVLHGLFRGVPDRFRDMDGKEFRLEDLEDDRIGYLVLVFSDGKGLGAPRASLALDVLARWPQVAWMQLQEQRFWDESAALPALHGLPVYPASRDGVAQALDRFTTERAPERRLDTAPEEWRGLPPRPSHGQLEEHVEMLLGDGLTWAQACAMMPPPCSLGLADCLRRRFYPHLPPDAVERLLALPGSHLSAGGIHLSRTVLGVLRTGFTIRRSAHEQREVLAFLIDQLRAVEPSDHASLAHQAWEWRLERIRLELAPDRAIPRLSVLARGPLGDAIRADLAAVRRPGTDPRDGSPIILLRDRPQNPFAITSPPLPQVARAVAGALGVAVLATWIILGSAKRAETIRVTRLGPPAIVRLQEAQGGRWVTIASETLDQDFIEFSRPEGNARIVVFSGGRTRIDEIPSQRGNIHLQLEAARSYLPCHEERPQIGLTIDRCGPAEWHDLRTAPGTSSLQKPHSARIGLAIRADSRERQPRWREFFLASAAVDVVYTVEIQEGEITPPGALRRILSDWAPWEKQVEVISWTDGRAAVPSWTSAFAGEIAFGNAEDLTFAEVTQKLPHLKTAAQKLAKLAERGTEQMASSTNSGSHPTVPGASTPADPAAPQPAGDAQERILPADEETILGLEPGEETSHPTEATPDLVNAEQPSEPQRTTKVGLVGKSFEFSIARLLPLKAGTLNGSTLNLAGAPLQVDGQYESLDPLPPGLAIDPGSGRISGTPTRSARWDVTISNGFENVVVHFEITDPRCPEAGQTLCSNECADLDTHPFHYQECFAIAPSLQLSAAQKVDEPPLWTDASLRPRRYYRLYYEWDSARTAIVVRTLSSPRGWDIDPAPLWKDLRLTPESLALRRNEILATDLEVHCSGPVRVASFSSSKRNMFEKLSTKKNWQPLRPQEWQNPAELRTQTSLVNTMAPLLDSWKELCARSR